MYFLYILSKINYLFVHLLNQCNLEISWRNVEWFRFVKFNKLSLLGQSLSKFMTALAECPFSLRLIKFNNPTVGIRMSCVVFYFLQWKIITLQQVLTLHLHRIHTIDLYTTWGSALPTSVEILIIMTVNWVYDFTLDIIYVCPRQ